LDDYNVTVDTNFLANALTVVMQMKGDIEEDEYVVVYDMIIDDETGYLKLAVDKKRATIN
jgi:hypothetical protein